jgi:hypothetical protein
MTNFKINVNDIEQTFTAIKFNYDHTKPQSIYRDERANLCVGVHNYEDITLTCELFPWIPCPEFTNSTIKLTDGSIKKLFRLESGIDL